MAELARPKSAKAEVRRAALTEAECTTTEVEEQVVAVAQDPAQEAEESERQVDWAKAI
jgi:hypothetical protein